MIGFRIKNIGGRGKKRSFTFIHSCTSTVKAGPTTIALKRRIRV
jgi:hypothetical protein